MGERRLPQKTGFLCHPRPSGNDVSMRVDRRTFCTGIVTAALTAGQACSRAPDESVPDGLARLLGLHTTGERAWLETLSGAEQRELYDALRASGQPTRRTVDLVLKVISRRERLFAYIGYPELQRAGICDGLIRE
jgi:hypothetical protein